MWERCRTTGHFGARRPRADHPVDHPRAATPSCAGPGSLLRAQGPLTGRGRRRIDMAQKKTQRGRKAVAIAAVTGVLGVGVYTTLASWTDNEWVVAGFDSDGDGTPDIGTSTFEVQQNRTQQAADAGAWEDRETNLEAGDLEFTTAVTLSPGTTLYAPVALRTVTD